MPKKKATTRSEQIAIALFQQHLAKPGVLFPRSPDLWADKEQKRPVQGLLISSEQFTAILQDYEEALRQSTGLFNPEKYYVMGYLAGTIVEDDKARHRKEYFGQFTETIGRLLLAELLRSDVPVPRDVRQELARLISPNRDGTQQSEREFAIRFRSKGKRPDFIRELQVSEDIANAIDEGCRVKQAIGRAMEKYEISRSEAMRIWSNNRDAFIELGWFKKPVRTKSKIKPD